MGFNQEIENERKEKLGLDKPNTKKIYDKLLKKYKELVLNAPREVVGYTICLGICDMHYYNKLGDIKDLYQKYGDVIFLDFYNSSYLSMETDEEGNLEGMDEFRFNNIEEFKDIKDTPFSIKELYELCKKDDLEIELYSRVPESAEESEFNSAIDISPYRKFTSRKGISEYLKSIKNK